MNDTEIGKRFIEARKNFRNNPYYINPNQETEVKLPKRFIISKKDTTGVKIRKSIANVLLALSEKEKLLKGIEKNFGLILGTTILATVSFMKFKDYKMEKYLETYQEQYMETGKFDESKDPKAKIKNKIIDEAKLQGVDPAKALAIAAWETRGSFNPNSYNKGSGALGIFQVTPIAAKDIGIDYDSMRNNPDMQIKAGVTYLKKMLKMFNGDLSKAAAAYNWGPTAVKQKGLAAAPKETREYIPGVLKYYEQYKRELQEQPKIIKKFSGKYANEAGTSFGGRRVTSAFGYREHPIEGVTKFHTGIDIDFGINQPIYAYIGGKVIAVQTGWNGGYGNTVKIKEERKDLNVVHIYAHLNSIDKSIRNGVKVTTGQLIGLAGSTGGSTGPHLHYQIEINGKPVDPRRYDFVEAIASIDVTNKNNLVVINNVKQKTKPISEQVDEEDDTIPSTKVALNPQEIKLSIPSTTKEDDYVMAYQKGWRNDYNTFS